MPSEKTYKTIGEVARILCLVNQNNDKSNTHTLRFWEKQFKQVKPVVLNGNRRYYDKKNIEILKKIKFLLKDSGMTINGVKKMLNNKETLILDDIKNKSIKDKIKNISKIAKDLKTFKNG